VIEIPGVTVTDRDALVEWLKTTEHEDHCAAHHEGLLCCLDKLIDGVDS
jgi:hypothetical protein